MRHDRFTACSNCQFKYQIVARIAQEWSPQKENLLTNGDLTNVINEIANIFFIER